MEVVPKVKIWLENSKGEYALGKGTARLLEMIDKTGSLMAASKVCGMSYNYAWHLIRKIEASTGCIVVKRQRGGPSGGSAVLTEEGRKLLKIYNNVVTTVINALETMECDING